MDRNQKRKTIMPNPSRLVPERQRVIFWHESTSNPMFEADLMLILNELFQKARVLAYTRFTRVGFCS